jgi:hypothetical protein
MKLKCLGYRLYIEKYLRGNTTMKGLIPSIILGGFILILIAMLTLGIFWEDEFREFIKGGFTEGVPIPASGSPQGE